MEWAEWSIGSTNDEHETGNKNSNMYGKGNLKRLKKMNSLAPEVMKAFWAFDKAAVTHATHALLD